MGKEVASRSSGHQWCDNPDGSSVHEMPVEMHRTHRSEMPLNSGPWDERLLTHWQTYQIKEQCPCKRFQAWCQDQRHLDTIRQLWYHSWSWQESISQSSSKQACMIVAYLSCPEVFSVSLSASILWSVLVISPNDSRSLHPTRFLSVVSLTLSLTLSLSLFLYTQIDFECSIVAKQGNLDL